MAAQNQTPPRRPKPTLVAGVWGELSWTLTCLSNDSSVRELGTRVMMGKKHAAPDYGVISPPKFKFTIRHSSLRFDIQVYDSTFKFTFQHSSLQCDIQVSNSTFKFGIRQLSNSSFRMIDHSTICDFRQIAFRRRNENEYKRPTFPKTGWQMVEGSGLEEAAEFLWWLSQKPPWKTTETTIMNWLTKAQVEGWHQRLG